MQTPIIATCFDPRRKVRYSFYSDVLSKPEDELLRAKIVFSDEAIFHLSGHFNRSNVRIWESYNQLALIEGTRDSPGASVFFAVF
jgi:hypothetical protein